MSRAPRDNSRGTYTTSSGNDRTRGNAGTRNGARANNSGISEGKPFHHAYNFAPLPPRPAGPPFADGAPAGHDRLRPELWNGRLRVRLTARTPLIVGETASKAEKDTTDHEGYETEAGHTFLRLRSRSGQAKGATEGNDVEIPVTSVKGMLRSAYEIATLSRFGVAARHDLPLAFRSQPYEALELTPVRIEEIDGELHARPLLGTRREFGRVDDYMPAALLPDDSAIKNFIWEPAGLRTGDGLAAARRFAHKDEVSVELTSVRNNIYSYWLVTGIGAKGGDIRPIGSVADRYPETITVDGWVCRTNQNHDAKNFPSKKHERIFFTDPDNLLPPKPVRLTDTVAAAYREVLDSYVRELDGAPPSVRPGKERTASLPVVEWARKTKEERVRKSIRKKSSAGRTERQRPLEAGDLLYGVFSHDGQRLERLLPVMVGRRPFSRPPAELLAAARRQPPTAFDKFSAADRVFGTVEQRADERDERATAYRGHVVISPVLPEKVEITNFHKKKLLGNVGLPLIELGAPKPSQARFYSAADPAGTPVGERMLKAEMYGPEAGLRGFKVFPRHRDLEDRPDDYVRDKVTVRIVGQQQQGSQSRGQAQDGQPVKPRTKRNASVLAWVRADSTFTFDIDVTNMTDAELGALLWLLDPRELAVPRELEPSAKAADFGVFRLGRGRPLGLGSVTLELLPEDSSLVRGETVAAAYRDLSGCLGAIDQDSVDGGAERFDEIAKTLLESFRTATTEATGGSFDKAAHIAALRRAATGYGDGVRVGYPRGSTKPRQGDDISEIVAWFQLNEKVSAQNPKKPTMRYGYTLPLLTTNVTPLHELHEQ
ncbi:MULTISPECIES: TIGR03986 family type III CRISPR-associated RAMP protein [unclassified Frankia]|uniref:TIGR03986 family type III CRISPR-associated RAMP protein n=1 Tax=unclassified Frankia TaxID=2632575 RepID=UPI002023DE56